MKGMKPKKQGAGMKGNETQKVRQVRFLDYLLVHLWKREFQILI
jgi:hypothetical protein